MCRTCWRERKLSKMRACASCLGTDGGKLKCIGYSKMLPGGGKERAFTCTSTNTGVSLTKYEIKCADLGEAKAWAKTKLKIQNTYNNTYVNPARKCTINVETDHKCPTCKSGKACQWIDKNNPKSVDSLESFEAFVVHGGKFGKE